MRVDEAFALRAECDGGGSFSTGKTNQAHPQYIRHRRSDCEKHRFDPTRV